MTRVWYPTAQWIGGTYNPAEADLHQRSTEQTNLSVGTESVGSLETFPNNPPRVGRSNERNRPRLFTPFQRKRNAPQIQMENYVRDGVDSIIRATASYLMLDSQIRPGRVPIEPINANDPFDWQHLEPGLDSHGGGDKGICVG